MGGPTLDSLPQRLAVCLNTREPTAKACRVHALWADWQAGRVDCAGDVPRIPIDQPGQPEKPLQVAPQKVPRRRADTLPGRAALVHALAHIEFNAINLALDAAHRFAGMPAAYYADWLRVADEEALHFALLNTHLATLGYAYGDFPAHNGLWDMALKTAHDPLVRMALVPRVLEARGLDVTPGIIKRLRQVGDEKTVAVLEIILRDEVGHVAIGSRWFKYCCQQRGLDSEQTFRELISQYFTRQMSGPFDYEARQKAGFTVTELAALECMKDSTELSRKIPSNRP